MPGWWCSTRSTRPSAAPRSAPAPNCSRRGRDGGAWTARSRRAGGSAETVARALLVNAAGPWVAERAAATRSAGRAPARVAPGQGQPHPRAAPLRRATMPIILQNARRPRRLRPSLRARLHADRHHRRPRRRRSGDAIDHAGGDRLSLRRGQPLFRAARSRRRTWSGPMPACAPLYDDGAGNAEGGHPRLSSRARSGAGGRRCSRCSAARSPPIAASPSTRWRSSRRTCAPLPARGPPRPAPRRRSGRRGFDRFLRRPRRTAVAPAAARRGSRPRLRHPRRSLLGDADAHRPISAPDFGAGLTKPRSPTSSSRSGPAPPRTSCGGAPSSACMAARR